MNRIFTLILGFLLVVPAAYSQTFLQVGTGTTTPTSAFSPFAPVYRASGNSGTRANRSNTLYEATELSALPTGAIITALAWEKANAGGTIPGNPLRLEIWMRNSPLTAPLLTTTTWSSITSSHSLVYNNLDAVIPTVPGWVNFALNTPFVYTGGGLEIATENQIGGSSPYATDRFDWVYTPGTGDFVIGVTGSTSFGTTLNNVTTSGAKNRSNIRIFYTVPLALDLQAEALLSPAPPIAAGSTQQVQMRLFNGGTNAVTSASIHYRVNGGPVVTESWTGSLAASAITSVSFATPMTVPLSGNVQVQAWVSNVNGQGADGNTANDSISRSFCLALPAGNYSVGTPSSNFPTLQSAISALNCGGILGPVVMQIASGTYTLSAELFAIPGANALGDVTFTPASGQLGDVTLVNDSTAQVSETLILSGTKGVTFSFLRFVRSFMPSQTTHILHMRLGAERVQVVNCAFIDQAGVIDDINRAVGMFAVHNNQLIGNTFEGFGHSIFAVGEGFDLNNQWVNNTFKNYLDDAMFLQAQQGALVRGNSFLDFQGTGTAVAACSLRTHRNVTVDANRILGSIPRYAIYAYDFDNHVSGPNRITNNEAVGYTATTITSATAIRGCYYIQGFNNNNVSPVNIRDQFDFINNTAYLGINTGSTSSTQALLYVLGGADANPSLDTINILNNNLVAYPSVPGGIPAAFRIMTFNVAAAINAANSNNNNFYFEEVGNPLIRLGSPATDYQGIAAWDSLRNRDSLSLSVNPLFVSRSLGIPTADTLNNKGTPTYVTSDLNGSPRSATTPDIGAYEFDVPPVELALTQLVAPVSGCGLSDTSRVRVQVGNLGTDTLSGVELALFMNGQWIQTKLFNDTILAGATRVLTFDSLLNLALGGRYTFQIYPVARVDANPANDTLNALVVNQLINNFPFIENFEAYQNGIPAFENGWTSSAGTYRWFVNNGRTSTNGTGPAFDATTGGANGRYAYVESSNGSFGQEATITSSCLNLTALAQPMLEFFYHGHGIDCYRLLIEQQIGVNWQPIDTLEGPTQQFSRQAWLRHRVGLSPNATAFRFRVLRGASFEGDWAIDDIRIAAWPTTDARVSEIRTAGSSCDSAATLPVTVEVRNEGTAALAQVAVGVRVGNAPAINAVLNRSLAPGNSDTIQLSLPFAPGNNQLQAYTALPNDGDQRLDTVRTTVFLSGTIAQFPYIDNFEAATNWHAGGINSSWQRATPAATVINSAFNGSNSWVTNATGLVNAEERSWLESPCFNFSQLVQPVVSFALWYNTPATAGANLQYSTNNGQSWQVLGSMVSGANWYTNDSIFISRGQPVWSGIINPSGWRQVQLPLGFLAGQSSVKFRFQMFSPANAILGEGVAIDSFRIADPAGSLPFNVQITPESCSSIAHTVTASFTNVSGLQQATVRYSVGGGLFNSINMTQQGNQYTATIPAQAAGTSVTWQIRTTGQATYESESAHYIDGFVTPSLGLQQAPANSNLLVDSRLAMADTSVAGLAASQLADGIFLRMDASRHLEIKDMHLGIDKRTGIRVYQAYMPSTGGVVSRSNLVKVGEVMDVRPDSSGFAYISLTNSIRLQAGVTALLYIEATTSAALRVEHLSSFQNLVDSNLSLRSWWTSSTPFSPSQQLAWPVIRMVPQSPVDSVQWYLASSPTMSISNSPVLQLAVGNQPLQYGIRFFRSACVLTDTFVVAPAGTLDLGISRILSPTQWSQVQNDPVNVQAVLRNFGTIASNQVQVRVLANNQLIQSVTVNHVLGAGDTLLLNFPGLNLQAAAPGIRLCVTTDSGDANLANDSSCLFITAPNSVQGEALAGWQLYPNPADQMVNVQWSEPLSTEAQIQLFDLNGRVIQLQSVALSSTSVQLETRTLPSGIYLVQMQAGSRLSQARLVIRH